MGQEGSLNDKLPFVISVGSIVVGILALLASCYGMSIAEDQLTIAQHEMAIVRRPYVYMDSEGCTVCVVEPNLLCVKFRIRNGGAIPALCLPVLGLPSADEKRFLYEECEYLGPIYPMVSPDCAVKIEMRLRLDRVDAAARSSMFKPFAFIEGSRLEGRKYLKFRCLIALVYADIPHMPDFLKAIADPDVMKRPLRATQYASSFMISGDSRPAKAKALPPATIPSDALLSKLFLPPQSCSIEWCVAR